MIIINHDDDDDHDEDDYYSSQFLGRINFVGWSQYDSTSLGKT